MHKQPHRAVQKTADNRYWQNQFHNDDAEHAPTAEFRDYEPPSLAGADAPRKDDASRVPRTR